MEFDPFDSVLVCASPPMFNDVRHDSAKRKLCFVTMTFGSSSFSLLKAPTSFDSQDLLSAVKATAEFVKKPLSDEVIQRIVHQCTFAEMAKNPASYQVLPGIDDLKYLRKGEVGDWKNHLTPEINEKFEAEFIAKVKERGLEFE